MHTDATDAKDATDARTLRTRNMDVKKLILKGESEILEFKETLQLKDEIGASISAFSNLKGGIILVGVSDEAEPKGIQFGKKTLAELAEYIKRNTDPSVYPQIKAHKIENKTIISIKVEESREKPVFFKGQVYKRVGDTSQRVTSAEIRKLAKESGEKILWDEQICEKAKLEDIDKNKVKRFLEKAKFERRLGINPNLSVKEALEKLNLIRNGGITNAGVLLFGKNPQKFFLQAEIKCARFKGAEPLEFIDMKVFGGDIIDQTEDALEFIKEHIKLHAEIKGTERVETWEYPIEAIREAITNAICHRDYRITSNVQIRIFDDRIEVWGVGPLPEPLTPEDLKRKHRSILRNPLIGKCFFLVKFIEEWGTGTNRIIGWCLKHGLPEPIFEEISGGLVVFLRKYRITEDELEKLNQRQREAIEHLKVRKRVSRSEYAKLTSCSERTAFRDLEELTKNKIIKRKGRGKSTYYELM